MRTNFLRRFSACTRSRSSKERELAWRSSRESSRAMAGGFGRSRPWGWERHFFSRWDKQSERGQSLCDEGRSAGPDAGGEGFDGAEAEAFVEFDSGAVFGSDGEG